VIIFALFVCFQATQMCVLQRGLPVYDSLEACQQDAVIYSPQHAPFIAGRQAIGDGVWSECRSRRVEVWR
jgi:hypothetical protein